MLPPIIIIIILILLSLILKDLVFQLFQLFEEEIRMKTKVSCNCDNDKWHLLQLYVYQSIYNIYKPWINKGTNF